MKQSCWPLKQLAEWCSRRLTWSVLTCLTMTAATCLTIPVDPTWSAERRERTESHMGASFKIVLFSDDPSAVEADFQAAFARIAQLDACLSNYKQASELNQLSAGSPHATPQPLSLDLFAVLQRAGEVSRDSDGAFDITVGPLTRLWRQARRTQQWPSEERLQAARNAVGYESVQLATSPRSAQLLKPAMQLDLGGIGAGYALDEVAELLIDRGHRAFLIDGSGDIRVVGSPPDRRAWRVAVGGLRQGDAVDTYLDLVDRSVATSGDLHQYFEFDGTRYSHLIDPQTGVGLTRRSSVTVIAPDGITADAWSSALAILGVDKGFAKIAEHPEWNLEARVTWLEGDERRSRETPGFAAYRTPSLRDNEGSVRSSN